MPRRLLLQRSVSGLCGFLLSTLGVISLLGWMNQPTEESQEQAETAVSYFDAAPPPPPPKPKRVERRRARKSTSSKRPAPSAPRLSSTLAGISFRGMPSFQAETSDVDASLLGDTDHVVMTEDTIDSPPSPVDRSMPELPIRLRKKGISGKVMLHLLIDTEGRVAEVQVLSSDPPGIFDEIATRAATKWRFRPGSHQGKPYAVWMKAPIEFRY